MDLSKPPLFDQTFSKITRFFLSPREYIIKILVTRASKSLLPSFRTISFSATNSWKIRSNPILSRSEINIARVKHERLQIDFNFVITRSIIKPDPVSAPPIEFQYIHACYKTRYTYIYMCVYISFRGGGFNVCNAKIFTSSNI